MNEVNEKDDRGLTPLHRAAGRGDESAVRSLLERGADPTILDSRMGASPLHHGAQSGGVGVAELLLEYGAFLNLQAPTHGVTSLMAAVWYRKPRMVEFLLSRPEINTEIYSYFGGRARDLIGFGARQDDTYFEEQRKQIEKLFDAYEERRRQTIEDQKLFATVANADNLDRSEQLGRVERILGQGDEIDAASPVMSSGRDGYTPLILAAQNGQDEIVQELLEAGADVKATGHYMRATPVHKAAYMGQAQVMRRLAEHPEFEDVLNEQGPYNGYTALHDAVWHGHTEAARILVESGARTDLKGYDGKTPEDLAREYRYDDIAELLSAPGVTADT